MNKKEDISKKIERLIEQNSSMLNELNQLKELIKEQPAEIKPAAAPVISPSIVAPIKPIIPVVITPAEDKVLSPATVQEIKKPDLPLTSAAPAVQKPKKNLERYIGVNLINKIGIAILVIGIGFFVKYAIDKNWINEFSRMIIGSIAGLLLIGLAHKMRKAYRAFSSVLLGGGIATLYFTFTIAFQEYQLLSQTVAFIIMIIITAFTVFLSVSYDRKELAIIAMIGGFASPFMVSTGQGNYIVLFSYLLILNSGMLLLAYYKNWNLINIIAFVFTIITFGGWLFSDVFGKDGNPYNGAFIFASLFYLLFFIMNIINNIKENRKFGAFEIAILTLNTFLYYSIAMYILTEARNLDYRGLSTAIFGLFNLAFAILLYFKKGLDKVLINMLLGFGLIFLSLVAPVQFKGNTITLFWAAEFTLLFWIAKQSKIKLLEYFSMSVLIFVFSSLIMDWGNIYFIDNFLQKSDPLPIILNQGFLTGLFVLASIWVNRFLVSRKPDEKVLWNIPANGYKGFLTVVFWFLLYFVALLELYYQLDNNNIANSAEKVIRFTYQALFFFVLMNYVRRKAHSSIIIIVSIFTLIVILFYPMLSHWNTVSARNSYLYSEVDLTGFLIHYANVALVLLMMYELYRTIISKVIRKKVLLNFFYWFFSFIILFIASTEIEHLTMLMYYIPETSPFYILQQTSKIGYPIIWGLFSVILMVIGMKKEIKMLRIISLSVFFFILLKLFIIDIRQISPGGKVAAFISLGVLLLFVSFMYQKLKQLIFKDDGGQVENKKSSD
jgi:uncharacterized membrane protein